MMRHYSIPQVMGNNLRQAVSRLLVKSPITAIKEFVSNSWDADSESVRIQIADSERTIVIEDDGTGMDEAGLQNFLSMGDSEKLEHPLTFKGRRKIGKFGIANTLLQFLGESYQFQTWKGDSSIEGFEEFTPNPTHGMDYEVYPNSSGEHGTRITIQRSKFVGSSSLRINRLEDALAWELPAPRSDFKITLNGTEIKRVIPDPLEILEFHDELEEVGKVDMKISLYGQPVRVNGLYVYVDQRAVGSLEIFQLRKALRFSPSRILIEVNADGLRDSIVFNREKMIEDEKFLELRKYIHRKLHGLGRVDKSKKEKIIQPSRELISGALKQTGYLDSVPVVAASSNESLPSQPVTASLEGVDLVDDRKVPEPIPPLKVSGFRTVLKSNCDAPATFSPLTGQLSYNQNHPLIRSPEITNTGLLNIHVLLATSLGIAEESYLRQGGSLEFTTRFNAVLARALSLDNLLDSVGQSRDSNETGRFAPSRDYSLQELTDQGIVTLVSSKALVNAGVFNPRGDRVSGKEINSYISNSANHTPAIDLVLYEWGKAQVEAKRLSRERVSQLAWKIDERLEYFAPHLPFIYNIGVTKPFFLVENEYVPAFLGLQAQGVFRGPRGQEHTYEDVVKRNLPKIRKIVGDSKEIRFASLDDLCGITRGSFIEVMKVIGYGQRHGLNLPTHTEGSQVLYSVQHFKKARLIYLGVRNE
ncbi:MAG: ATP-binding protein [Candidatus Nanoarchaeia archaeon]|nr:ATP-binding protein [Candidatus Nanoarchaeia archaeon]